MFKLIKILNSGVNVAEPCYVNAQAATSYTAGAVAKLDGGVLKACAAGDTPTHLVGETLAAGEAERVLAYPISGDMVFEAPVNASPEGLTVGGKVTLAIEGGEALALTATAGGAAEIYELSGAAAIGDKISVRFYQ